MLYCENNAANPDLGARKRYIAHYAIIEINIGRDRLYRNLVKF